ncbi:MAG TPA: BamA/TamA family outer membrane protein [Candidatus Eisenbacteria bacterium]
MTRRPRRPPTRVRADRGTDIRHRRSRALRTALAGAALLAWLVPGGVGGAAYAADDLELLPKAARIRKVVVEGAQTLNAGDLKKSLSIKMPDWLHPFRKPRFYRGLVQQEARTMESFARQKGLAAATVSWDTTSVEGGVSLTFRIEEGPAYQVAGLDLSGVDAETDNRMRNAVSLEPGKPWTVTGVEADRAVIDNDLADRGHPFSRIRTYAEVGHDSVLIVHDISPGPVTKIDGISVAGGEGLSVSGLEREITVDGGDMYSRREIERSRQRLYDTGFFNDVSVAYPPAGIDSVNNTVDVQFNLVQRKQKWMSGGVGYTSDNLLRLTAEWGTRSIFGTGRGFKINARTAREIFGDVPFFTERQSLAQATLSERWLFGTRIHGSLNAYYTFDNLRNEFVKQDIVGAGAEASYEMKERRNSVALLFDARRTSSDVEPDSLAEEVCEDDPSFCRSRYITRSVVGRLTLDERNDFLNPTRGYRTELQLESAGGILGGDSNFLKGSTGTSWLRPMGKTGTVGVRLRFGAIEPDSGLVPGEMGEQAVDDITSVPFEERFISGGANTVRGYQENTLNGLADGKDPSGGGLFEILANVEMRFPIRGPLGGVLFVDAGNVWREYGKISLKDFAPTFDIDETTPEHLRWSVGGGIRFNTPVGPVRLEGVYRLSPARRDYPSDIHLAVGQVF